MANWQRKLNLKDASNDVQLIARTAAERLRSMQPFGDEALDGGRIDLAYEFESLAEYNTVTVPDFDSVMESLYDWADTSLDGIWNGKKACWVATSL